MQSNAIYYNQTMQRIGVFYRTTFFELIPFVDFNWLNKTNTWKFYEKLTPASADAGSGADFAVFCKRCDAFGGQLHAIVNEAAPAAENPIISIKL